MKQIYHEYVLVFQLCDNIRTGLISLTAGEYRDLPNYVIPVWNKYNEVYRRLTEKK